MQNKKRKDFLIPLLTVISDVVAIELSFMAAYWLRFHSSLTEIVPIARGIPPWHAYVAASLVAIPIWLWLFQDRRLYRPRRVVYFSDEFFAIVRLVAIGMLVVTAIAFLYRAFSFSRMVFVIMGFSAAAFISAGRYILLKYEQRRYGKGKDLKRVVVVGTSEVGTKVCQSLHANPSLGYEVFGYAAVDDRPIPGLDQIPLLGPLAAVPELVKKHNIDVVLIALTQAEHSLLSDLVRDCQGLNVEIMMVPDILELMTSLVQITHIEGIPFLGIKSPALSTWNSIVKRLFDIAFAGIVLIAASPLFFLLALLIKLDSRGPVFYLQERVGLDGELFKLMKFRSMRIDAEDTTGPVWSRKNDPRTTKLGRFLRRFSIDELPQLINVLKGDMSIVGPRPERLFFVEQFKKDVPRYLERHRVKTGMTGWAQVNGLRGGGASITERTKYDVYYVENWSLVFDIKIILKTIRAVLFGEDAY